MRKGNQIRKPNDAIDTLEATLIEFIHLNEREDILPYVGLDVKVLRRFFKQLDSCLDDKWQCPCCGHEEMWWTNTNAHYLTKYPKSPKGGK